jgi:nucleoside-diphosphate-sugar epimerase
MKKCTTTGGTGFIGKNFVRYLKDNGSECNVIQRKELYDIKRIDFDSYETVIHMAGIAHDLKSHTNQSAYYKVNFELTKKLYDKFLTSKAKKFIFISSVKAAADEVDGALTENELPKPKTDYGRTKLMAEQYILRQPLPEGKSRYILRPCMTHGQGNKGNLNLLYKLINKGLPYPLAGFDNKRSFLSVQNLCFVINEIIERDDIPSDIYHISDDQALSTAEVVSILSSSLNKRAKLWKISPKLIMLLAKMGDMLHLPLTTDRLSKLTQNYVVSNSKIKTAIKKSFPVTALDGLRFTAESFNKST